MTRKRKVLQKPTKHSPVPPDIRVSLLIEHDDGEVLVSETRYHIHATGATKDEALEAFWRVFYGYEGVLAESEEQLGEPLRKQLQYIREVKAWEERLKEEKNHDRTT